MVSPKTTLEVRKETKDRVNAIKGPLTADQLINLALDALPPERVAQLYQAWQEAALRAIRGPNQPPRFRNMIRWPRTGSKEPQDQR